MLLWVLCEFHIIPAPYFQDRSTPVRTTFHQRNRSQLDIDFLVTKVMKLIHQVSYSKLILFKTRDYN